MTLAPADTQRRADVGSKVNGSGVSAAIAEEDGHTPVVADVHGRVPSAPARLEPLSADRFGVRFTADAEFCESSRGRKARPQSAQRATRYLSS